MRRRHKPSTTDGVSPNETVSFREAKRMSENFIKRTRGTDGVPVIVLDRALIPKPNVDSGLSKLLPDSFRPDPEIMMGDEGGVCHGRERS